ncbi:MAG: PAS domain-containing protein, partial [Actinomycetota bacterium]
MTASVVDGAVADAQSVLAVLPVPVLLLSAEGRLLYQNAPAAALLASLQQDGEWLDHLTHPTAFTWLPADLRELRGRDALTGCRRIPSSAGDRVFEVSYARLEPGSSLGGFALLTLTESRAAPPRLNLGSAGGAATVSHGDPLQDDVCAKELVRSAGVLLVATDRDGGITHFNEAAERSTGCPAREALGQNWFEEWLVPTRSTLERRVLANVARDGQFGPYTSRVRNRSGSARSISWRTSALREGDQVIGTLSVGWDVTELSATQDRLSESEERHRTLLASLPQRIFVKDQQGAFVSVNDAFARDFGRRASDFVGKTDFDLFAPELAEKYREDDRRVVETRQTETIVEENVTRGNPRYVEVVKAPVVTDDGAVLGVVGVFTDITERKLMEQELARERDLLHILMDNIPDQIFFKDRESRFTRVNRATATAIGLSDPTEAV